MFLYKRQYILLLIGILWAVISCKNAQENNNTNAAEQQQAPKSDAVSNLIQLTEAQYANTTFTTCQLQQKALSDKFLVNGRIDVPPQNLVSISVPMGGYVKKTDLLPGLHISKGQVLAIIEDQQYIQLQQDYLMTQSKLHFADVEYRRQKDLNESEAGSAKAVQQAEAVMREQNILLAGLREKLQLIGIDPNGVAEHNITNSIAIKSPIDGFVSKVNVNIGKYVNPSDILFELVNPADIHLNLRIFEKDLNSIAIGKQVMAYTNAQPTKKYACEIILISKDVAPDGTTEVHCHFKNYDKTLIPGMYMNAEVITENRSADVLPETAVVSFEGNSYVFIEAGKREYRLQSVKVGRNIDGYIEIIEPDLPKQQNIVDKGAYNLLMKVKNVEEE